MSPREPDLPVPPPRDADGPVFAEPWQAQAFALTVRLAEDGVFTWNEWAQTLGETLAEGAAKGLGGGEHYYEHWLGALERLALERGLAEPAALSRRKNEWAEAYRTTPHGRPVELRRGQDAG
ncbi:MAG TPA: nitrile hydratase accessory protein [Caulobacteraceae bacterium]|nr:nitrile hydratase accessory protein [Caulobacteraceae bacterium]